MAVPKVIPTTEQRNADAQDSAHDPLLLAIDRLTQTALDGYDDEALLSTRQSRLVARIKRAVRDELRRHVPELISKQSARQLGRLLGEHVLNETRIRQFDAFERWLTAQYGPIGPIDEDDFNSRWSTVNGIHIFRVDPPHDGPIVQGKE